MYGFDYAVESHAAGSYGACDDVSKTVILGEEEQLVGIVVFVVLIDVCRLSLSGGTGALGKGIVADFDIAKRCTAVLLAFVELDLVRPSEIKGQRKNAG